MAPLFTIRMLPVYVPGARPAGFTRYGYLAGCGSASGQSPSSQPAEGVALQFNAGPALLVIRTNWPGGAGCLTSLVKERLPGVTTMLLCCGKIGQRKHRGRVDRRRQWL